MKMKCDHCKSFFALPGITGKLYPETGCLMGHWEGIGEGPHKTEDEPDPWADCTDFNESRLENCGPCEELTHVKALNGLIYSCGLTGNVIPQYSEMQPGAGQITDFLRIPMSCPRSDNDVIKTPYPGDKKP